MTDQDGELLSATSVQQQALGSFFQENRGAWANTVGAGSINRKVASLGLEEDETFTVEVIAVPEYYTGQNAMTLEDILALKSSGSLKEGSFLTTTLTVDDTASCGGRASPRICSQATLTVTARDNQYIAAIQVSTCRAPKFTAMPFRMPQRRASALHHHRPGRRPHRRNLPGDGSRLCRQCHSL